MKNHIANNETVAQTADMTPALGVSAVKKLAATALLKEVIAIAALILCCAYLAQSQDVAGDWQGVLTAGTVHLRIVLHIAKDNDGNLKATMDSVDQGAFGLPVSSISFTNPKLKFAVDKIARLLCG